MKALQQWYTFMIRKRSVPQPLGRWAIDTCDKKRNTKIDFSNEDHCGPCGQYAKIKIDLQDKQIVSVKNNDTTIKL